MNVDYSLHFDRRGRTASVDDAAHIRNLVFQVLFTAPGERVNRPDFGSGLWQLVFAPNSEELVTATQYTVQGSLQRWLGDLIQVEDVRVENRDSTLWITVRYLIRRTQARHEEVFSTDTLLGGATP